MPDDRTPQFPELPHRRGECGISLVETLVSLLLTMIASLALVNSFVTSMRVAKLTEVHYAASTLAASRIEEMAAIDVSSLSSSNNSSEPILVYPGMNISFSRQTTITINADNSRTVAVQVSSNSEVLPTTVSFGTTLARWE